MLKLTSPHRSVRRAVLGLGALLAAAALAPAGASAQEGPAYTDRDRDKVVTKRDHKVVAKRNPKRDPDAPDTPRIIQVRTSEGNSGDHTVAVRVYLNCPSPRNVPLRWCHYDVYVAPQSATDPSDYFAWWGSRWAAARTVEKKEVFLKRGQKVGIALYVKVFGDTEVETDETFDVRIIESRRYCDLEESHQRGCGVFSSRSDFRGGTIVNDDSAQAPG